MAPRKRLPQGANGASATVLNDAASYNCARSERIGWPQAACVASVFQGAATLTHSTRGCPAHLHSTFKGSVGWWGPGTAAMQCQEDGRHPMPGTRHVIQGEFNRSSAFGVLPSTCASFVWARAKAAKQERQKVWHPRSRCPSSFVLLPPPCGAGASLHGYTQRPRIWRHGCSRSMLFD